jgi:hypothetical protein
VKIIRGLPSTIKLYLGQEAMALYLWHIYQIEEVVRTFRAIVKELSSKESRLGHVSGRNYDGRIFPGVAPLRDFLKKYASVFDPYL